MNALPLTAELSAQLNTLSETQLAWLSGYCWAKSQTHRAHDFRLPATANLPTPSAKPLNIQIISASQTGNARSVARQLSEKLTSLEVAHQHSHAADFKTKSLNEKDILILITSTQGEGEPPEEAISLHQFLHGKKAPKLNGLRFAVLGLGDKSYPKFCGAAREFDAKLAELGANRLTDLSECDLDFQTQADDWIEKISLIIQKLAQENSVSHSPLLSDSLHSNTPPVATFTKESPYTATLLLRQKITGRDSERDVQHVELDLSGSGIRYQPGDAVGVWFSNDVELVEEVLSLLNLNGDEIVNVQNENMALRHALLHKLDLTQNTAPVVQAYAQISQNPDLQKITDVHDFASKTAIVSLLKNHPAHLNAQDFVGVLRPLTPRLYSIASSQNEVGEEVHLTVGVVRYEQDGTVRTGGASGFLGERLAEDGKVQIFIEPNPHFRLPENPNTPVIMIAAGTGMAPFRAFMQERAATDAAGQNWLFFGNPHFTEDFLYQAEWQTWAKDGLLNQYHFAWSRDQAEKIYVQDKIREQAANVWQWLQNGAHVYVCGDAGKMAKAVETALIDVIESAGKMPRDEAQEWLDELRQNKRYQRDVY